MNLKSQLEARRINLFSVRRVFKLFRMSAFLRVLAFIINAVAYIVNEITNLIIPRRAPIYPPIENPLLLKSVNELLTDLKGRKITSYEIVTTYIARIKEVNARLNAVIENRYMEAIKEARHADNLISQAKDEFQLLMLFSRYPLLGIPFTVKEACGVKGLSYSVGSVARKDEKSPENGDAVEQMRAAGAIPLLVSANPEFCLAFDGETIVYGKCLNPYDMRRSSGGSSSGEGTLNGAGASTFGLASDISGSIRLPSLFCGVFGHKPTGGLISVKGHYPYSTKEEDFPYYLQMGPITRFAKDLPLLLQVMAGENAKKLKLTEEIDFQKLKIYYSYSMGNFLHVPVDFEIKLAITRAVKCFEKGGIATEELHLKEFQNAIEICLSSLASIKGLPSIVTQSVENKPNKLQIIQKIAQSLFGLVPYTTMPLFVELMILVNAFIPTKESARWKEEVKQLRTKLGNLLGTNGVLILPTYHKTANFFNGCSFLNISGTIFMLLFNVLGFPATHVPMGLDRRGLPVGFQVVAAPYMDKLCLQVAAEMEAAFGGWVQPQK
ncbi:fatty-acid amide hydrolase 2-A [Musca domestica]|uniref:Fatty-acid amide hydrolase 2-A n=1 Tax=Musca domestica TaxID=7370 RepID=A0A9J7I3U0_MUSDO|nr:fatty-acid amide hydrolase 2-A [Musca domestica]